MTAVHASRIGARQRRWRLWLQAQRTAAGLNVDQWVIATDWFNLAVKWGALN